MKGSASSYITAIGITRIYNTKDLSKNLLVKNMYLCENLRHSLLSGIQLWEDNVHFQTVEEGVNFMVDGQKMLSAPLEGQKMDIEGMWWFSQHCSSDQRFHSMA